MTRQEIRDSVLQHLHDDGSTFAPSGDPDRWKKIDMLVNDVENELASIVELADPSFLTTQILQIDLSGGVGLTDGRFTEANLPSDFRKEILVMRTNVTPARAVTVVPLHQFHLFPGDVGDYCYFRGTGSGAYAIGINNLGWLLTVHYTAGIAAMSVGGAPTDVSKLPAEWHWLIAIGVAKRALMGENSPANPFAKDYEDGKRLMAETLARRVRDKEDTR